MKHSFALIWGGWPALAIGRNATERGRHAAPGHARRLDLSRRKAYKAAMMTWAAHLRRISGPAR